MDPSSSVGRVVPKVVNQLNQVAKEVQKGKWEGHENDLSMKIRELISDASRDTGPHKAFEASVITLIDALTAMDTKSAVVKKTIGQLNSVIRGESSVVDLKRLPSDTDEEIQESIQIFRNLIEQEKPNAVESFVEWMEYSGMSASQLNLSKEEWLMVAPHLTVLEFNVDNFSEEDVQEIISNCHNLKQLDLQTDSIKTTPELPRGLEFFTLAFSNKLISVSSLNEGLQQFSCFSNERLNSLPAVLPNSITKFHCVDHPYVKTIPELHEGITSVKLSGCGIEDLPSLPSSLKILEMSDCENIKNIKALPDNLEDLDVSRCDALVTIPFPLPESMKLLTISWCSSLVLPDTFASEKPPGLKVVK
ncbi:MAG: E3 ubiquitin-protein ligase SlrP [Chlamydiae bacterium]|nr:E3 ubiquitin-protein ligase SlrP [Chlamydiota bacterium]